MSSTKTTFSRVLNEFKEKESPETILVIGEDPWMIRLALAWPNVLISEIESPVQFSKQWNDVQKWNWLWKSIQYSKKDVYAVVGHSRLESKLRTLIANRILYPDGAVNSYVLRYFRTRVIKLLDKKPASRRSVTSLT